MVQIINVTPINVGVIVEFLTNGIVISTLVKEADGMTPQEIVEKGYSDIRSYIQMECDRLGREANHDLPAVTDEVIGIELLGIEDISFTEGQMPIEKVFRCAGHTKYGKTVNLTADAIFSANPMVINPTASVSETVTVTWNEYADSKPFNVFFTSQAEIAQREAERIAWEQAEAERIAQEEANRPPSTEEVLGDLIETLVDKGVLY